MLWPAFRRHAVFMALAFVFLWLAPRPAFAQPAPATAWTGFAACQIDVDGGEHYNDNQLHTWRIKSGVPPVREGAFAVHEATWSVTGKGYKAVGGYVSLGVGPLGGATVNRSTWTHSVRDVKAPIAVFVRASDQRLSIVARHAQLNVPKGATGEETYTWVNGHPFCKGAGDLFCNAAYGAGKAKSPQAISFTVHEYQFPRIEDAIGNTHPTGWTTPMPVSGSVFPLQPPTAKAQATCTWDFTATPLNSTIQMTPPKSTTPTPTRGRPVR
jgi:hypothetical protein